MDEEKPLPIRSQVTAPPGKLLISADLSQAEAWIVAYKANEQNMKKVLGSGLIHWLSARIIFEKGLPDDLTDKVKVKENVSDNEKYLGKKMNHSCNYRTGPFMIAIMINAESDKPPFVTVTVKQTKLYHERWLSFYNLDVWWKEVEEAMYRDRTLTTPYGRKITFYGQMGDSLFKEATAYVPQSTVADHMYGYVQPEIGIKGGLLGIKRNICNKEIKMINSSHDSVLLEVPEKEVNEIVERVKKELLRPIMISGETFTIPVDIDIYERWNEKR